MQETTDVRNEDENRRDGSIASKDHFLWWALLLSLGTHLYFLYIIRVQYYITNVIYPKFMSVSVKNQIVPLPHKTQTSFLHAIIQSFLADKIKLNLIYIWRLRIQIKLTNGYLSTIITYQILMQTNQAALIEEIQAILSDHLPQYKPGPIKFDSLCGMTNQTYKLVLAHNKPVVFKVLSPIIDRQIEGRIINQLSKNGVAPKCYYTSLKYRVEEYIDKGRHPKCSEILDNQLILKAIIEKVSRLHEVKMPAVIPHNILAQNIFSQDIRTQCLEAKPHQSYNKKQFQDLKLKTMNFFDSMKLWLKQNFEKNSIVSFCHNDLNQLNIFIRDVNEKQKQAILIDFQYSGFNYIAFDIANFLNESCIQYGDKVPGFKIVRKISKEDIRKACSFYREKYEGLESDVGKMLILANYYWALWSIRTKPTQSSPAFCPYRHGVARMELFEYYKSKYDN